MSIFEAARSGDPLARHILDTYTRNAFDELQHALGKPNMENEMNPKINEITIDGQVYVPKSDSQLAKSNKDGLRYCVVRTYSAGVHIGWVSKKDGKEVELSNSRRLHYWEGACSLSQVAMDGIDPEKSRIAMELPQIFLTEAIEIIPCSEKAAKFFQEAPAWKC